jgi:hypothetical protein
MVMVLSVKSLNKSPLPTTSFFNAPCKGKHVFLSLFCLVNILVGILLSMEQTELLSLLPSSAQEEIQDDKWGGLDVIVTYAEGNFYRQLIPLWLSNLRYEAKWNGVVYIGCVHCKSLYELVAGPENPSVVLVPMYEHGSQWKKFNTSQLLLLESDTNNTKNNNKTNLSSAQHVGAFVGKGRAAKATKWALVLKVALRLRNDHPRSDYKYRRIMFLDIDNLATRVLPEWTRWVMMKEKYNYHVGNSLDTQRKKRNDTTSTTCPSDRVADLTVPRGRLTLGESINTGVFFTTTSLCSIRCLHGAVKETRADGSILSPKVNDQEALYRMLQREKGNGHCKVSFIPTKIQRFASTDYYLPVSFYDMYFWWRSGTSHFTRAEKRVNTCTGEEFNDDFDDTLDEHFESIQDDNDDDDDDGSIGVEQITTLHKGNKVQRLDLPGRRKRGWWVEFGIKLGLLYDGLEDIECTKPYERLAKRMKMKTLHT